MRLKITQHILLFSFVFSNGPFPVYSGWFTLLASPVALTQFWKIAYWNSEVRGAQRVEPPAPENLSLLKKSPAQHYFLGPPATARHRASRRKRSNNDDVGMHMPRTQLITTPPKQNETNTAHKAPTRIEVEARIAIHYGEIGGRIILNQPEALSHYLVGYK
jgi:hypothetical protein